MLTKWIKRQHEKKPVSNLMSMQNVSFEQTFTKFIKIFVPPEQSTYRKKIVVETISVAIDDSFEVRCLNLYLINIFTKSTEAERCTGITFKLTLYCLLVAAEDLYL